MMKNVYSLGAFQVSPQDFQLDILYQDPGGGFKRYIPANNTNVNTAHHHPAQPGQAEHQ